MANEYYVFETKEQAEFALDYINNSQWFPMVGVNAFTGKPEPEKQMTMKWTDNVNERVDGKWCFPRIPSTRLDAMNVSVQDRQDFFNACKPAIEEYQADWFPPMDEEPIFDGEPIVDGEPI